MKTIKVFDYFQKISYDVSKPTSVGAIISILAAAIILILLFVETAKFLSIHIKKDFIVFQDISGKSTIDLHFSIYIPHHPCALLAVDQEDKVGLHRTNIEAHIVKRRIPKTIARVDLSPFLPYKTQELLKAINEDEGCLIEGFVEVNKVAGNIHISYHPFRNVFDFLVANHKEEYNKMKLNHKLNYLVFGDRFHESELNSYDVYTHYEFPNFVENSNVFPNFDYFVKIVPHLLQSESGVTKLNYQYAISSNNRKGEEGEMPMIMINYDMSEVTTQITRKRNNFLHFLTHICAIVGGIFVVFSILNRVILSFYDPSDKDN
jgi:hypothetical protein